MDFEKLHLHWRVSRHEGKEYRSYSLARSYRENGKNRKEIILKLGKLSDQAVKRWQEILIAHKRPDLILTDIRKTTVQSNYLYLDLAVALEAWKSWGLSEIFDSIDCETNREIPLSVIAVALAINRCVDPSSKLKTVRWFPKTALPFLLNISPPKFNTSRIYRELAFIEKAKDRIAEHLYKKMQRDYPNEMTSLFYDLSSASFTGSRCSIVKWGHCKEGYERHIVLALVVNTIGLPIYWEVLNGGTADATTISWLQDSLQKRFSKELPTMVFDRGMVSNENLALLEQKKIKYISAMDKNQIGGIAKTDADRFLNIPDLDPVRKVQEFADFIKVHKNAYCKEIGIISNRRYILCFNPQLFRDQRAARDEAIVECREAIEAINQGLSQALIDRSEKATLAKFTEALKKNKVQGFAKVKVEEKYVPKQTKKMLKAVQTYRGALIVDENKKLEAGKLDGLWLLVTNHTETNSSGFVQDTKVVVSAYREKVMIESAFRDIKSFVEIAPVHHWNVEHVKAHYTVCVLAYLIDRTLTLELHARKGEASAEVIWHQRLYEELAPCVLNRILFSDLDLETLGITQPTQLQLDLLKRPEMTYLVEDSSINKLKIEMKAQV